MFESTSWVLEEAENKFDALMASVVRPDRKLNDSDELVSLIWILDLSIPVTFLRRNLRFGRGLWVY